MAAETEAVAAAQIPVSPQIVANAFVQQYYHILHHSPGLVHRFYQDISKLGRPEEDGSMGITTTMQAINEKIVSINYDDFRAEIKSVDAQESFNGGVHVLVTGYLTGKEKIERNFVQSFFLAPQDSGYFVLNDMFRYVDNGDVSPVNEVAVPETVELILALPGPAPGPAPAPAPALSEAQESRVPEQSTPSAEELIVERINNPPPENGEVTNDDEVPVAEVVDEVEDNTQMVVESDSKIEEIPKKSYASIVMHLKETAATFSPPPAAPKVLPKNIEQVNQSIVPATDGPVSTLEDNGNNQDGGADGYSIYIRGLPMSANETLLEEAFKKFGTIKSGGIQVRSNRQQGFCFGFVEFEEASSVQKALEASPVIIAGRHAFVEEKRSTNTGGFNRARFQSGRGFGFRNDGGRGRGNYGGGRGYNRGDFNGRNDFGNRAMNRGGFSTREGYQRSEHVGGNGGRMNRAGGGMFNGRPKNITPPVSASA